MTGIIVKIAWYLIRKYAKSYRRLFSLPMVGITGSCGKTTTRVLLTQILSQKYSVVSNQHNYNDRFFGLPSTLVQIQKTHQIAVIEMGTLGPGDIAYMANIVKPSIAIITNVAGIHLDVFNSIDDIAREKGDIIKALPPKGVVILNADDPYFSYWQSLAATHSVVTFGIKKDADVVAKNVQVDDDDFPSFELNIAEKSAKVKLMIMGEHHVYNALAASAAAFILGMTLDEIKTALEKTPPFERRLVRFVGYNGALIIDDSFAATPPAVLAAIKVLMRQTKKSKKILVLSRMTAGMEERDIRIHREIGRAVKEAGIAKFYTLGEICRYMADAFGPQAHHFMDKMILIEAVKKELTPDTAVLVKGGYSTQMNEVVAALVDKTKQ